LRDDDAFLAARRVAAFTDEMIRAIVRVGEISDPVAAGPVTYRASWMTFDNAIGATKPIGETTSATTTIAPPAGIPSSGFIAIDIAAESAAHPAWKQPVRAVFRQETGGWKLVGLERMPDRITAVGVATTASK
jgi:hypothetical protein